MLSSFIIINLGRKKPHWGEDDHKPNWWPSSLPFADPSNGPSRPNVGTLSRIIMSYAGTTSGNDSDSDDYQSLASENSDPDTTNLDAPIITDNAPKTSKSLTKASDDILTIFASLVVRFYGHTYSILSTVKSTQKLQISMVVYIWYTI